MTVDSGLPTITYTVTIGRREVYRAVAKVGDKYRVHILGVQMPSWFPSRIGIYNEIAASRLTGRQRLTLCGIPLGWYMRRPFWKLTREVQP